LEGSISLAWTNASKQNLIAALHNGPLHIPQQTSFRREKCARPNSTECDVIGEFVAGRLLSLCSAEQRLGDHKFQDNGEVEVLQHGLALVSTGNGKVRLTT
jgi:hypothetical protein